MYWKVRKPRIASDPVSTRDQAKTNNGKDKICEQNAEITRCDTTQGTEKKLLGDAMRASKQKHIAKKRVRKTTVEDDLFEEVKVEEETYID